MDRKNAKESFLQSIGSIGPRVLEALISASTPDHGQVPEGSLFASDRIAFIANSRSTTNGHREVTPLEVPHALAQYVAEGIVGVRPIYGGSTPRNGNDENCTYGFEILDIERARQLSAKEY